MLFPRPAPECPRVKVSNKFLKFLIPKARRDKGNCIVDILKFESGKSLFSVLKLPGTPFIINVEGIIINPVLYRYIYGDSIILRLCNGTIYTNYVNWNGVKRLKFTDSGNTKLRRKKGI